MIPLLVDLQSTTLSASERALLQRPGVAGLCLFARNLVDVDQARELVAEATATAGRALIVAIDQEGGGVVRLPQLPVAPSAMALGAAGDPQLSERLGFATGRGLRRIGVNVDFAPVADLQSNPENPIIGDRAFGADPHEVARHVVAFSQGLQRSGVAATLKHFPGHGDVAVDSHLALPRLEVSAERLHALELIPFREGVRGGAAAVMSAHLMVTALDPDRPATLSLIVLQDLLRHDLGFDGVVFSDALDMRAIADRWGPTEAALLAAQAGVDVPVACNLSTEAYHAMLDGLEQAQAEGRIDPAQSAAAQRRVDALLQRYPSAPVDLSAAEQAADEGAEAEAARRAVARLGALPTLTPGASVLVFGHAAESGSGASDPAAPVAHLVAALAEAGLAVEWTSSLEELPARLPRASLLLVASSERRPLGEEALGRYRAAFAAALRLRVAAVHVALWNPIHARALPGPALLTFGFRAASARAAVAVLMGAEALGHPPIELAPGGPA